MTTVQRKIGMTTIKKTIPERKIKEIVVRPEEIEIGRTIRRITN
jgi:hypothetical protein